MAEVYSALNDVADDDEDRVFAELEETFGHVTEVWLPNDDKGERMTYGAVTFRDSASMTTGDGRMRTDMREKREDPHRWDQPQGPRSKVANEQAA